MPGFVGLDFRGPADSNQTPAEAEYPQQPYPPVVGEALLVHLIENCLA